MKIGQKSWEIDVIPISWGIDGASAPSALATLDYTNKARARDFTDGNDMFFEWKTPYGMDPNLGIYFQVGGWITNVTPPIDNESVSFGLKGCSVSGGVSLGSALSEPVFTGKLWTFTQYQ